jgi:hypothetical protein
MTFPASLDELDSTRKKILFVIVLLIAIDAALALFVYDTTTDGETIDARTAITNAEVLITTGIAAGLGLLVAVKQGRQGLHGKTYLALALGLAMWTIGEIWWVYYEVSLQNELPDYGVADIFWLAGYGFLGYHLFKNYRYFAPTMSRRLEVVVGAITSVIIAYVMIYAFSLAQGNSFEELTTAAFRISFATGDFVMIFPALLLVVTLRKAKVHFSPWFFIALGLLLTGTADISFAYVSILELIDAEWIANLLYDAANMTVAGGLYWYYKHIVAFGTKAKLGKTTIPSSLALENTSQFKSSETQ